jgi:hypothetical protein
MPVRQGAKAPKYQDMSSFRNGTDKGKLVFRGIEPETVQSGIPNDIIPAVMTVRILAKEIEK